VLGDETATRELRERMRAERGEPEFFDRGPGYARLAAAQRQSSKSSSSDSP
jgi:hypothetical protein